MMRWRAFYAEMVKKSRKVSTEQIFEDESGVGFVVAVFDNEWGVSGESEFAGEIGLEGTRTRDEDGVCWNVQYAVGWADDVFVDEVEDGCGFGEDGSRGEDGTSVDMRAFVNAAVSADKGVVLDDDGECADGFDDAADLCGRRNVAVFSDLSA